MAEGQFTALLLLTLLVCRANCDCRIIINEHLEQNSRLMLHPHSSAMNGHRFFLPNAGQGFLSFAPQQEVVFACPLGLYESARCVSGTTFQFSGPPPRTINVTDITCRRPLRATIRNFGRCHNNKYNYLGVGLMLRTDAPSHEFIKLIDFCFNPKDRISLYAKFTLMQGVEAGQRNVKRHNFTCSQFYGNLSQGFEDLYSRRNQFAKLVEALGSRHQAEKYFNRSVHSDLFLVKGHLTAFRDFVYFSEQQATAVCVNTAPMWQVIRKGNWRRLEDSIREYASSNGKDLTLYSGTYDVLLLPNVNGTNVPVHLGTDPEGRGVVPVPELFWKLVYDRLMRQGIVFIGINNHDESLQLVQYEVCDDVCNRAQAWFRGWNRSQVSVGYVYCCTVPDFLEATNAVPEFRDVVLGLLTQ